MWLWPFKPKPRTTKDYLLEILDRQKRIIHKQIKLMSALSDYIAKQTQFNADQASALASLSTDLGEVAGDVDGLKETIVELQGSIGGDISAEDKAALDQLVADAGASTAKLQALAASAKALNEATPPKPPPPTP